MTRANLNKPKEGWRKSLYEVIFEAEQGIGRIFDVVLIIAIALSVLVVLLDSVASIRADYGELLYIAEWVFTILFSIEYILRLICVRNPFKYIFSFYGIIDFLAVIPTYISLFLPGTQYLLTIRVLRILRIFRVLKLVQYLNEAEYLKRALMASRRKISVFLFAVLIIITFAGSLMYVIEGAENGFTSIPTSIYWAIVTLTTVGFGDIAPQTNLGQLIAACIMIMGYGIIAVPTGIVSYEMARADRNFRTCDSCGKEIYDADASYCKFCGNRLKK